MSTFFKNDIGTTIQATVKEDGVVVDLSSQTTLEFNFKKPGGTVVTVTAVFSTDGTDGNMEFVTVSGTLDTVGLWRAQGYMVLTSGTWTTTEFTFEVKDIIE